MDNEERKVLMAVDFQNILYGSQSKNQTRSSNGITTTAIRGFFFKFNMFKRMIQPSHIVIASDLNREDTFRKKIYPDYKGNRKPQHDDMYKQVGYTLALLNLLGYPIINHYKFEADDILGMTAKYAEEKGYKTIIISADKDLYQLITDNTVIFSPMIKLFVDKSAMMALYGLSPSQWIELKMLQGDQSDNIPGIYGIGKETAGRLMRSYGTIENIYNHLDDINIGIRSALITGKSSLGLLRELVTIVTDYDAIHMNDKMLSRVEPSTEPFWKIVEELELYQLTRIFEDDIKSYKKGDWEFK